MPFIIWKTSVSSPLQVKQTQPYCTSPHSWNVLSQAISWWNWSEPSLAHVYLWPHLDYQHFKPFQFPYWYAGEQRILKGRKLLKRAEKNHKLKLKSMTFELGIKPDTPSLIQIYSNKWRVSSTFICWNSSQMLKIRILQMLHIWSENQVLEVLSKADSIKIETELTFQVNDINQPETLNCFPLHRWNVVRWVFLAVDFHFRWVVPFTSRQVSWKQHCSPIK